MCGRMKINLALITNYILYSIKHSLRSKHNVIKIVITHLALNILHILKTEKTWFCISFSRMFSFPRNECLEELSVYL